MCAVRVEPEVNQAVCCAGPRRGVIVVEAPRSGGHAKLQAGSHIEQITSLVADSEHCIAHRILGFTPSPLIRTEVQGPGKVRAAPPQDHASSEYSPPASRSRLHLTVQENRLHAHQTNEKSIPIVI